MRQTCIVGIRTGLAASPFGGRQHDQQPTGTQRTAQRPESVWIEARLGAGIDNDQIVLASQAGACLARSKHVNAF